MPLTKFKEVQNFINDILIQNEKIGGVAGAPHKNFWVTLSYNDFVHGNVPGVTDPTTKEAIPILKKGDSKNSNIILALQGKGTLFDPHKGAFGQMPANGPPMFTDAQIKEIADWIDADCPK